MDVSWQGVIFIWVAFLWPIFISIAYSIWKGSVIPRLGAFFLLSVVAGYIVMVAANFLLMFGSRLILENPALPEAVGMVVSVLSVAVFFAPPLVSTHLLSRKFEITND
jgi:hypothetical protein